MSQPWWGKEIVHKEKIRVLPGLGPLTIQPELHPGDRQSVISTILRRKDGYTYDWTNLHPKDAGVALTKLFGEQMEPVLRRLNRLPEKAFVEFLNMAGIKPIPPRAAKVMLKFSASDAAPRSVQLNRGFQVSGPATDGSGETVIFETDRILHVAPGDIAEAFVGGNNNFLEVDVSGAVESEAGPSEFKPFGTKGKAGSSLYLGLSTPISPGPTISIGIRVAPTNAEPPPVSSGGIAPLPASSSPLLQWEIFNGNQFVNAEIIRDETRNYKQSGIIELRMPRLWREGRPPKLPGKDLRRWLRLRIMFGKFDNPPLWSSVQLNLVTGTAARTIYNEVVEHIPRSKGRRMRLRHSPVLSGTLILTVNEGEENPEVSEENFGSQLDIDQANITGRRWKEVDDFSIYGPESRVFVLDPSTGEVIFGDDKHGKAVPLGFRNIIALKYQVGGGEAGAVEAEGITSLVNSAPHLTSVINETPASGGSDQESQLGAMRRGPQEIRARGRAVTTADFALMALRAPGAEIQRAHGVSGFHPKFKGGLIPGVVTVFVVPPKTTPGSPIPDEENLKAVSEYLSREVAPLGAEVVAASPKYHKISIRVSVELDPAADVGATVRQILDELDSYLHPLTGGEDGQGWPFGGRVRYDALIRRLINQFPFIRSIPFLNMNVDGIRIPSCKDYQPTSHSLLWPEGHEVIPMNDEVGE